MYYRVANLEITDEIGCKLSRALPMKRGRIASIFCQYERKTFDDHRPCFMSPRTSDSSF
ncbi:hypothetical protein L208DRAFT_1401765 [Tricholoma matsutake]|nr:hypothetical protein L208DRAFT_1403698 [Tricholoma matsutake 945]KAF8229621.1 hypothetical protein L208DRAFT_1401765 [Tricholoma matsutake 945]